MVQVSQCIELPDQDICCWMINLQLSYSSFSAQFAFCLIRIFVG